MVAVSALAMATMLPHSHLPYLWQYGSSECASDCNQAATQYGGSGCTSNGYDATTLTLCDNMVVVGALAMVTMLPHWHLPYLWQYGSSGCTSDGYHAATLTLCDNMVAVGALAMATMLPHWHLPYLWQYGSSGCASDGYHAATLTPSLFVTIWWQWVH